MYTTKKTYVDPSAAHERALKQQLVGAYSVVITSELKGYVVTSKFRGEEVELDKRNSRRNR